ncbi:SusC/RagA family TonB-linked outer membrane protein [Hymenobacter sp. CRA2]|uniref:SusC/RagA family TonB-linked outer membrane protein n=1 Tax=Hymenobacter sp. CRA2 TaxID=1955620 RepID=UPI0009CD1799|nr:TonB-dependent receptor [Hymenobacter sp. CRA2]OON66496.1 SusC/RagA family TonB-linked outer membrane protein [Hymenobacter sp. CRA2]
MNKNYAWLRYRPTAALSLLLLAAPGLLPLRAQATEASPAEWQLSGKVVSNKGEALPGVTVALKGTARGATTGPDGSFALSVPETSGTLVFSFVGFQTVERKFSGAETFTVTLLEDTKALEEVVVVGYGTQKKADVTGAIATFDVSKVEERPLTRVDQALVGQMAGVRVQQNTGVPGRGLSVQVRGAGSISAGNEPLYVLDGFPLDNASQNGGGRYANGSPLDNLNPNDIESIQVLKDAAAAAIYGSRAANGVVIITTKRGKTGKPQISFNTYVGVSRPAKKLDLLSGDEWVERASEWIDANWVATQKPNGPPHLASQDNNTRRTIYNQDNPTTPIAAGVVNTNIMKDPRWALPGHPGLQYIDWQDEAFRTGGTQSYQVAASGATDNVNYYVSGNYTNQMGFIKGLDYKRYSARANVEVKASNRLKFGLNVNPTYSVTDDPGVEGKDNRLHQLVSMAPVVEDTAGVSTGYGKYDPYRWGVSTSSPVKQLENSIGRTTSFRTLSTLYAELELVRDLRFRTTLNLDNNDVEGKSYTPPARNLPTSLASGSYSGYRRQTFVNENTLTYSKTLADKHDFTLLAGYSYNTAKIDNVRLAASGGFINNTVTTLNAATNITGTGSNNTTESRSVLISYFGRLQYSYLSKYLLSTSIRRDGSSRFGSQYQFGIFPAASVGWRISQENFMAAVPALSDLKLRASIGFSGNNSIGDYNSKQTLGFYNYAFGGSSGSLATGQAPNRAPNDLLKWERNRTLDFGLDVGLLKNRIYATFDYYTKTSKDLLLNVPINTASGFPTNLVNIGEVENRGWEVELTTHNLNNAFVWNTSVNFSHNENEVKHLGPGDAPIEVTSVANEPNSILQVGQPMYSIYVVKQTGILSQADIDGGAALFGNQKAGDPRYEDYNGDGKIDTNDRQILGQPNPKYTWGITNTFKYKGFDLSVLIQGQNGGSIYSLLGRAIDRTSVSYLENALGHSRERWRSPEDPGNGEKGKVYANFGFLKNSDWLYSSDYYRVRNITLGYDLGLLVPKKVAQGMRIYVTAENWFGHDKYYGGYNPDAVNTDNGSTFTSGVDYGGLPLAKTLILGLNATF